MWIAEAWGQDAVSVCGYLASVTERVAIGTALMQIPARPPAATAMAAATIDVMSGGRFRLGLGVSGPQVSEGWYGTPFARPVSRTREYVEIVRKALAGEKLEYSGREYELPLPGGLGKPLRLLARPSRTASRSTSARSARRRSPRSPRSRDGWLPFLVDPEDAAPLLDPFSAGLEAAGRARSEVDVAAAIPVGLAEDIGAARAAVKPILAFYLGAMGAKDKNFYVDLAERAGFGDEARRVQELWLGRDHAGALNAVSDGLVDRMAIATTPSGLDDRLAAYDGAGIDTLVCVPCGPDRPRIVEALAAATATS